MKTLYLFTLTLSAVLNKKTDWSVIYPDSPICAVRGFNVSIPCTYYYPTSSHQVTQMLWCSMNSNTDKCNNPPYVYNSSSHTESDFVYAGDNKSDCTLIIHNVQMNYTGEYKFRFITNVTGGRWTGEPGVNLQVTDLKVSLIRLSGNGTLKQGDAVNLTCDVNCTHTSSQFVWSKNNERLPEPGPVLHFPALTVRDSGNYTCTWKSNVTSGSETISLHVEGKDFATWQTWIFVLVICVVILVIAWAVIYHRRKREEAREENSGEKSVEKTQVGENTDDKQTKPQPDHTPQLEDETKHMKEVTYSTVCVKDKKVKQGRVRTQQQKEDESVIYSTVKNT